MAYRIGRYFGTFFGHYFLFIMNIVFLIVWPINAGSNIKQFEAAQNTIIQQRKNKLTEYERAALTQKIIEQNQWLAKEQFWAKSVWLNWYYDKKILELKPIE